MFQNYIRTALRGLVHNRGYATLHIGGMALGITVFLLIFQYVRFERSYENFLPNRSSVYRVSLETYEGQEKTEARAENYYLLGPVMKAEIPEVMEYARLFNLGYINNVLITNEQAKPAPISIKQRHFFYADSSFLSMLGYPMVRGNAADALAQPNSAVISEEYAKLYFGAEDPIGKILHMHDDDSNDHLAKVTGVFKDLPANTHLRFDILFSDVSPTGTFNRRWGRPDKYTFVQLRPGADPARVEARLKGIFARYRPELKEEHEWQTGRLQRFADIHLGSDLAEELEANGNGSAVFFLSLIGLFVLVIAWINYINLSTAGALVRAREVGVRKVAGAQRGQLMAQFLTEAALVNFLSLVLAYILMGILLPYFNRLSGLSLQVADLFRPWMLGLSLGVWVLGAAFSGLYPALILSGFRPIEVLKGRMSHSAGGVVLRKGLVVFQFTASVAMIAGTIIVYRQVTYMMGQDTGMNINQVLVMDRPALAPNHDREVPAFRASIDHFRRALTAHPDIVAVSNSSTIPGKLRVYADKIQRYGGGSGASGTAAGSAGGDSLTVRENSMDFAFMDVFKMHLLAGRNFSPAFPKDPDTSVILTESAVRRLGFRRPEDAIGVTLKTDFNWNPIVVGVVNDYHQESFKARLEPTMFTCDNYEGDYFSVRIQTRNLPKTVEEVRSAWNSSFPGNPFEYFFLDEYFNRQYAKEQQFGSLFVGLTTLAILISCLGLFGLAAYTASQRTKEIGIRKVLGASVLSITTLLSKDFLRLVVLAIVLASPLTWLLMSRWLQGFAYRTSLSWWIFALAGLSAVGVALVTVGLRTIRAARANPVKSLRSE